MKLVSMLVSAGRLATLVVIALIFLHALNGSGQCATGTICFEIMKGLPAGFIAAAVGWIAYQQFRVARAKLKLDLFDRRYVIFLDTWKILSETAARGTLEQNLGLGTPFNNFIPQASFLFGSEVEAYLNKAASQWARLRALQSMTQRDAGVKTPAQVAEQTELEQWFFNEAEKNAKQLFSKYLSFEGWS